MRPNRWLLLAAFVAVLGMTGWGMIGSRNAERAERLQQEAYARRVGDALIRQGISLYQKKDYAAAITAWERYIKTAPPSADTISIREMIGEAREAATRKSGATPRRSSSLQAPPHLAALCLLPFAESRSVVRASIRPGRAGIEQEDPA